MNKKIRIRYFVPCLHSKGGIHTFAKCNNAKLSPELGCQLLNWEYDLNIFLSAILRYAPKNIRTYLFLNYFSKHFQNKYDVTDVDLMHFWYIQATMPFMDKQFIVTCQGTELLKKHMQGFRKELYAKVLENAQVITTNSYYAKKILINNFPIEFIQLRKDKVYNSGESAIFK